MRIISQERTVDVSYENGSLSMSCGKYEDAERARIYYYSSSCPRGALLAEYTSKAKAIKAMEKLRDAYVGKLVCQNVDLSDDKVVEIMKKWNMGAITVANSDVTRVDYINNTVFQFPKDEEIEVEDEQRSNTENQQEVGKD